MNPEEAEHDDRSEPAGTEPYEPPVAEDLESAEGTVATTSGIPVSPPTDFGTG